MLAETRSENRLDHLSSEIALCRKIAEQGMELLSRFAMLSRFSTDTQRRDAMVPHPVIVQIVEHSLRVLQRWRILNETAVRLSLRKVLVPLSAERNIIRSTVVRKCLRNLQ